jgi:MraZ protein
MEGLLSFEVRMTTALRGRAHIKLDPKGRLSLPTSFRSSLGRSTKVVLTNNTLHGQNFLDLFPFTEWLKLEKKVATWPALKPEVVAFQRYYVSSAEVTELDSQGRLLVPQHFRDYAELKEDLVLAGMGSKIEIWSQKKWGQLLGDIEKDFTRITQVLADL